MKQFRRENSVPVAEFLWGDRAGRTPQGWPGCVAPPGSADFLRSAKAWLFSLAPGQWHFEPALHRFPQLLARMVRSHLEASIAGTAANHSGARQELDGTVPESAIDDLIAICGQEQARMSSLVRQVLLVEEELAKLRRRAPRPRRPRMNS
ncbi:hypothetical protein [Streptomyces formicae]|uniref:Uncharacterized protein n=1 Tax=Streptomyces formicae TaxID=1616117 RepID=A0ABY3WI29_9ACTN|nr:hypothetical protein [Streptomyces formicae]UNM12257.1 hypothetical protein J4032_12585 [Streptomyces formicae]